MAKGLPFDIWLCGLTLRAPQFALTSSRRSCYPLTWVATMPQTILAIYENGVLKPMGNVDIPEHRALEILILEDDLPLSLIGQVAEQGRSYDFLRDAAEDIYTACDGEAV